MMTNRFAYVVVAIIAAILLTSCQTAQKSGSTSSEAPSVKDESPKDTQTVKGIDDWEGEISGKPAPNSKFKKLKIGMSVKQVTDLIGQPTDQGSYVTAKAWIPFYHGGSDRYRHEMVYKGQGRLIFASSSYRGDYSSGNLVSIIHNAQEGGYR
jgi:hypothetical protein